MSMFEEEFRLEHERKKEAIRTGNVFLGIEFGSTRIKAALIDENSEVLATGCCNWENDFENGLWTYPLNEVKEGLAICYKELADTVSIRYKENITSLKAMGVSAMMHGYMPFDENGELLVPFRTWRNTNTGKAAEKLTKELGFTIPLRWSVAHLYQAVLDKEPHVSKIARLYTLAGYVHFLLTGEYALGVGDASGMFPVTGCEYNKKYIEITDKLLKAEDFDKSIADLLPKIKTAGEKGAVLTEEGARLIDPTGTLKAGIPVCPPEGDAGTGMTATNSVRPGTGNISAGTSIFAMIILKEKLKKNYPMVDIVSTPDGLPAAMVHCNNCCSEIDAWARIFDNLAYLAGSSYALEIIYEIMFRKAETGEPDCGGITAYNFLSAEPVAEAEKGAPMYFRTSDSRMNLANFMRAQVYAAIAPLRMGTDILLKEENIKAESFAVHGGFYSVPGTSDQMTSDALKTPVSAIKGSSEGGAWGMALLAEYMINGQGKPLSEWLETDVFPNVSTRQLLPNEEGSKGFDKFMERYISALPAQRKAGNSV